MSIKTISLYVIEPQEPEIWTFDDIVIENGQRNIDYWVSRSKNLPFIKQVNIKISMTDLSLNTATLVNNVTKLLNYEKNDTIDTVTFYKHSDYVIQGMFKTCYNDNISPSEFNYFATITNNECKQIYGKVVFYTIKNSLTVDTSIKKLLSCMCNFYFLETIKITNGKFESICVKNYEPTIESLFKSYYKLLIDDWVILSSETSDIENIKNNNKNISDYKNIVFFKTKKYIGDLYSTVMSMNEHNKDGDFLGVYMDIDNDYVYSTFFC